MSSHIFIMIFTDADHGLLSTSAHNQSSCTFQGPKGDSSTSHKRNRSELSSPRQEHDNTVLTKDVVMQLNSDNEDRGSRKSDSNGTHSNCRDRYNGMTDSNKQKEVCTHSAIICGGTNAKTTLREMIPEEQAEKQAKSKGLEIIKNYMRSRAGNLCRDEKIQTVNIVMKPEGFLHERSSRYKHYPVKEDLQKMSSDDSEGECLERSDAECEEDSFDAIPSQVKLEQKSRTSGVIGHQLTNYMLGDDLVPEGGFNTAIFHDMTPQMLKDTSDYPPTSLVEILPTAKGDPELGSGTRPWHRPSVGRLSSEAQKADSMVSEVNGFKGMSPVGRQGYNSAVRDWF